MTEIYDRAETAPAEFPAPPPEDRSKWLQDENGKWWRPVVSPAGVPGYEEAPT